MTSWGPEISNISITSSKKRMLSFIFFYQVYIGLSELFGRLQDADKSALYAAKAYDLSRNLQLGDLNTRHQRAALLQMASALCKQGELGDAHDYCSVRTKFSQVCLKILGFRKLRDWRSYPGIRPHTRKASAFPGIFIEKSLT